MDPIERLQKIDRSKEIDSVGIRLYFLSRNPWLLAGMAAAILSIALGLGWWLQRPLVAALTEPLNDLRAELSAPQPDPARVMKLVRAANDLSPLAEFASRAFALSEEGGDERAEVGKHSGGIEDWLRASKLAAGEQQVALALHHSLDEASGEPNADLLWLAHFHPPVPFANEQIGDFHLAAGRREQARSYYEREVRLGRSETAREKLVALLLEKKDYPALRTLLAAPAFARLRTPELTAQLASAERRWGDLVRALTVIEQGLFQPQPMLLAGVAGLVWLLVALQAIQPGVAPGFRTLVPLAAILMGMLSTFPTLLAGEWQAQVWSLSQGHGLAGDLLFFIAGVGLREEAIKLLFFLPFVPFLLMRGSRLEMLMIAGFVGLGFAVQENLHYFQQYGALAAFVRFLTANFFHLALTGLIGFTFCEALLAPRRRGWIFPATFLALVLAHGLYDVLAVAGGTVPLLHLMTCLIFILVSLAFFRTLRPLRDAATDQLNIAATLVGGLAVLAGLIFVCAAREAGFHAAISLLSIHFFSLCMICYMFYWQLGEGMSAAVEEPARPSYL